MAGSTPLTAGGNIYPCRFVKYSDDYKVTQATANDPVFGISQMGTNVPPIPDVTSQYAAVSGQTLHVFQDGEECLLELAASLTAGTKLKSDANGKGVAVGTGSVQEMGAILLEDGADGELRKVRVQRVGATI